MVWLTTLLFLIPPQDAPKVGENDLQISVLKDGTLKINGRNIWKPSQGDDHTRLEDLFVLRRYMKKYQEVPGKDDFVKYTLFLDLHPQVKFHHIQKLLMIASHNGGVTRVVLLTNSRKEFAWVTLPRDKGLVIEGKDKPLGEVRIVICAGGDLDMHLTQRVKHVKANKDAAKCVVAVANKDLGLLISDESKDEVKASNRKLLEKAAARDEAALKNHSKPDRVIIILDADLEITAPHIIRILKVVQGKIKRSCEIAVSPLWEKYYGMNRKGRFRKPDDRKDDDD